MLNPEEKKQLESEISHIFESGPNEIRIINMIEDFITKKSNIGGFKKKLNESVLTEISQLPDRIQGKGDRADEYNVFLNKVKVALINDKDFNQVIFENTKRMTGEEEGDERPIAISIWNNDNTGTYLIIRANSILKDDANNNTIATIPYQKCPKCDGQGTVSKPPYVTGDVNTWSSSTSCVYNCDVCNGQKIIPQFVPNIN
jgi:hypothetical protein